MRGAERGMGQDLGEAELGRCNSRGLRNWGLWGRRKIEDRESRIMAGEGRESWHQGEPGEEPE